MLVIKLRLLMLEQVGQPRRTGVLIKKGHLDPHRGKALKMQAVTRVMLTCQRRPGDPRELGKRHRAEPYS